MLEIENKYWSKGFKYVAGIDEAGRGPLAGPVVAACVIFNKGDRIEDIKDSKKLTDKKRNELFKIIYKRALGVGIGIVHESKIDEINILKATFLAMNKSIGQLSVNPDQVLVDGPYSNVKIYPVEHVVNGDNLSQSIAAASIIAKVTRDHLMIEYDKIFPEYGFAKHKGYGTKYHMETIKSLKSTPIHRKSFKVVNEHLPNFNFFKQSNNIGKLGSQIIASNYIKKNYFILDSNISLDSGNIIDYCFENSEDSTLLFVKSITKLNDLKFSLDNTYNVDKSFYKNFIDSYLIENNYDKKYSFTVISIEFIKSNKHIIKEVWL